jgi:hypothetical protein
MGWLSPPPVAPLLAQIFGAALVSNPPLSCADPKKKKLHKKKICYFP